MVDFGKLVERAKGLVDQRGGAKSVGEDAKELKDIAGREGSMTDKAKDAASALREPGAGGSADRPAGPGGEEQPPAGQEQPPA